ncbi:germination protein YpeB [Ornithinibacillus halotolerans]|uniref:Germination protein YpeB n=1 Tax=Ornithinibacillus halotolerans TaxID=1274357 RepID=A0A916RM06_9BACI|nr:germination protein YpeB [Ornithinibacillus halotolerans]GGA61150.1 germination protein YpeB [Ornithinibacillus halotolerans]
MLRWITIVVLAVGVAGTAAWGYKEHQDKNAILIQAENTYQRAFHELTYNLDMMHDKIGTAIAMNSRERLSPQLADIWRLTSESLSNVGQLPLSLLPFNKTEEFLSDIGDFTYRTAIRDLEKDPLSDEELNTLKDLYAQAGDIKDELRQVQHTALENNLRWMDVQLALATEDEQADNTIIDGFKTVEKKIEGYAEGNVDSSISGTSSEKHKYENISGKDISEKEALVYSRDLFNVKEEKNLRITGTGDGADIPLYSVSYNDGNKNAYLDLTQKGGHPITLLVDREVKEKKISLNEGYKIAEQYIQEHDFESMELLNSSEYGNIGIYSFIYNQDGVRVFADAIEVKVALDNGDILGLTANNYFLNHHVRDIPKPKLSSEEARNYVNPNVDIQEEYLAVITNELGEEVVTYEFLGILGDDTYRIFINAMNGAEEMVEKLNGKEINYAGI